MKLARTILVSMLLASISLPAMADENCPKSTIIPSILNVEYMNARNTLIASGWKPLRFLLSVKDDPATYAGVSNLIDNGVFEMQRCDGQSNQCNFGFRDKYGNLLEVYTKGEFGHVVLGNKLLCITEPQEWDDRAAKIAKIFIALNSNYIAQQIQKTSHPLGSAPALVGLSVAKYDDHVSAEIAVEWHVVGFPKQFTETIAWTFNKSSHVSTIIKDDNANFAQAQASLASLNNFFEIELYPLVRAALEK